MVTIYHHTHGYLSHVYHSSCLSHQLASMHYTQSVSLSICRLRSENFHSIWSKSFWRRSIVFLFFFQIRTIGLTICILFVYASAFLFIKLFPILLEIIDLYGCMVIYTIGSVAGAIFVLFALEETKGRSLDMLKSTENKWKAFAIKHQMTLLD